MIFKPGGAYPFFEPPAAPLRNTVLSLEDPWGPAPERLRQHLAEAASPAELFRLLGEMLLARRSTWHDAVEADAPPGGDALRIPTERDH